MHNVHETEKYVPSPGHRHIWRRRPRGVRMVPGAKRCSIAQQGQAGKSSGEKRKRSEKGKEKAEGTSDKDESLDKEPLVKKAKVVAEDTPPPVPESIEGKVEQHNEVEDRVEGEAEQPWVVEGLGQGAREVRPDEATLVVALWELTKVCWQGFDDM